MTDQKPMTAERLAEIEARAAKATAGPWKYDDEHGLSAGGESVVGYDPPFDQPDNRVFIINSRADIPDLAAEVRRLKADNAELLNLATNELKRHFQDEKNHREYVNELKSKVAGLEAELARLKTWIPVAERLPEDGVHVFVHTYGKIVFIARHEKGMWFSGYTALFVSGVTRWQPLPEAPEGGR